VHAFTDSGPNGPLGRELYRLRSLTGFHSVRSMAYINTEWLPNLYGYKAAQSMIDWFAKTRRVAESDLSRWLADIESEGWIRSTDCYVLQLGYQSITIHIQRRSSAWSLAP
jgi:hypothetical protein